MSKKGRRPAPAQPQREAAPSVSAGARWRSFFLGELLGAVFGRFTSIVVAPLLGFAGLFLVVAWQSGPQRAIDKARFSKLTARVEGRIVESWLAVEFDPSEMGPEDSVEAARLRLALRGRGLTAPASPSIEAWPMFRAPTSPAPRRASPGRRRPEPGTLEVHTTPARGPRGVLDADVFAEPHGP